MPSSSSMHPHARHVAPRLMFASEPSSVSPRPRRVSELEIADHSISPSVAQRRSPPHELEQPRKPRSRRCFVCGTTGRHPLDFRVCPRTAVLLRRSLAKINDEGRLVSFDGSPLPMTRHPGGVAAHILSHLSNPTRAVPELPELPPTPRVAHIPPQLVAVEPRVPSPPHEFNSSSPHAIPPVDSAAPALEHIPLRRVASPFDHAHRSPSDLESRARASWLLVFLESLLDGVFRAQLRVIVSAIDGLGVQDSLTLQQCLQPVFERISLPLL